MGKQVINPANLMTVADYAKFIRVERQTVYNWIKEGKIKQVEFLGKSFVDKSTKK
jgi:excisionase family DNA binding protein